MEGKDRPVARKAIGFKESKNLPILRKKTVINPGNIFDHACNGHFLVVDAKRGA